MNQSSDPSSGRLTLQNLDPRLIELAAMNARDVVVITEAAPVDEPGPRIIWANGAVEEATGWKRSEILGKTPRIFQSPLTQRSELDRVRKALIEGRSVLAVVVNQKKDGTPFWVELSIDPIYDQGGKVTHFVGIQRDISERIRSEEQVARSEKRYRELFEKSRDGIFLVDAGGLVTDANPAFCGLLGYSWDELTRKTWMQLTPESWLSRDIEVHVPRMLTTGESEEYEKAFRRKDGSLARVSVKGWILVDNEGKPFGAWVRVRDISVEKHLAEERARFEEKLRETQRLESLGLLASGIAHDFNNILMTVQANLDILEEELPPGGPGSVAASEIALAVKRASEFTKQLLVYAGSAPKARTVFDVIALIRELSTLLRRALKRKASFDLDLPEMPLLIHGDPPQVRQVLMNLITNAVDAFEDAPGRVGIRACSVGASEAQAIAPVTEEQGNRYILITVEDNGRGIPDSHRNRIFDPFFTTKGEGRGLGLSSVLGIVRSHQGYLNVQSEPGTGTTFNIYLPEFSQAPGTQAPGTQAPGTQAEPSERSGVIIT